VDGGIQDMGERLIPAGRLITSGMVASAVWLASGCGSPADSASSAGTRSSSAASSTAPATSSSELVGRWELEQSCDELIDALHAADLDAVLPSMLEDWFPDSTPGELARKAKPCQGATPRRPHSHFFTADGQFGSVDQTGQQVDDGPYQVLDDHTVRIGEGSFTYSITDGETLILHPVIEAADRRQALAHPLDYNTAGWQAAVAWGGRPWKRVDCGEWSSAEQSTPVPAACAATSLFVLPDVLDVSLPATSAVARRPA